MITIGAVLLFIVVFFVGFGLLWLFGKLIKISVKAMGKLFINSLVGAVILLLFNFFGGIFGLHVALTPLNALIAGAFGVPGAILLLLLA